MAGLDFDKMDDLELFVRHFRHRVANDSAEGDGKVSCYNLCEAIDIAWAEVSTRREREHAAWMKDRGLGFLDKTPAKLQWQPAARNDRGWLEYAELPGSNPTERFIVCKPEPGLAGYVLKLGAQILPASPFSSIAQAKGHAERAYAKHAGSP